MQPELFPNLGEESQHRGSHPPLFPHRYLRVRVAYEDLIFVSLSLVMVLLAGFCLGVERGKRLSAAPIPEIPVAQEENPVVSVPAPKPAIPPVNVAAAKGGRTTSDLQVVTSVEKSPYVIQCASFRDPRVAQEEAIRLKRQGFDARVVKQGKYYELRVVGYRARAEALDALPALKKTYQDGFVKRLSSG